MADIPDRLDREARLTRSIESIVRPVRDALYRGNAVDFSSVEVRLRYAIEQELAATYAAMLLLFWADDGPIRLSGLTSFQAPSQDAVNLSGMSYAAGRAAIIARAMMDDAQAAQQRWSSEAHATPPQSDSPASRGAIPRGASTGIDRSRSETVGTTETTAAGTAGEEAARRDIERRGAVTFERYWVTERDSKVCPVCYPLHGQPESYWQRFVYDGPPAHPNCRCHLRHEVQD